MPGFLDRILGIPLSAEEREWAFRNTVGDLTGSHAVAHLLSAVAHNTEKAGALLAAQGMFVVADTFALDHGWPKPPLLTSMAFLFVGAMLAMSNLRSTAGAFWHAPGAADPLRLIFNLLRLRIVRFNIALYLTFLSVVLLALAAMTYAY